MRDPAACVRSLVRASAQTGAQRGPWVWVGLLGAGAGAYSAKTHGGARFPAHALWSMCAQHFCGTFAMPERAVPAPSHPEQPRGRPSLPPPPSLGGWHRHMALPVRASPGSAPSAAHRPSRGSLQRARGRSCLLWAPLVQRPGPSSSCSASTLSGVSSTRGISAFGRLEMRSLRPALASGSELMRVSSPFPHVSAT